MIIGVVVIGRNEGDRLRRCLLSVLRQSEFVVYVDSGSTDGSIELALSLGVAVVELDPNFPFSAARARNEGFVEIMRINPAIEVVQFVDGDCEIISGWLLHAAVFLECNQQIAVVSGRLSELHPNKSIYNLLCDIEWNTSVGEVRSCGGIAMFRSEAFSSVGGYRKDLIAGEEPELCLRLREIGWKVWRLAAPMATHDAAMTYFRQWWRRAVRGGYAYAEGVYLHGRFPKLYSVRESARIWFWALFLPLASLLSMAHIGWFGCIFLLLYPWQMLRVALRGDRSVRENFINSFFLMLRKWPELQGQLKFFSLKFMGKVSDLIEYK